MLIVGGVSGNPRLGDGGEGYRKHVGYGMDGMDTRIYMSVVETSILPPPALRGWGSPTICLLYYAVYQYHYDLIEAMKVTLQSFLLFQDVFLSLHMPHKPHLPNESMYLQQPPSSSYSYRKHDDVSYSTGWDGMEPRMYAPGE